MGNLAVGAVSAPMLKELFTAPLQSIPHTGPNPPDPSLPPVRDISPRSRRDLAEIVTEIVPAIHSGE